MNTESKRPLDGVRVVELANYVAAPIVGRFCADLGAEVIKIEGRGGDAWRATSLSHTRTDEDENPLFDIFNVGKKSVALNIKTEEGKGVLLRLLEKADVFITNTRNQSLVKLGLDYESLKDRFPRLIYATLTGYGYEGPDCNAPGFDNIAFWSRPGFAVDMMVESEGSYPCNSRYAMGDTIAGSFFFGSVMTALYQRERTGKGDFVTMSLYNAGIWMSGGSIVMAEKPYEHPFPEPRRFGIPMNLAYRCRDGEWLRCTIFEYERYAPQFFDALGITEAVAQLGVTDLNSAMDRAEALVPVIEEAFRQKTCAEWQEILGALDIVNGRMGHFRDVLTDEQAWANGYVQEYACQNGEKRVLTTCPVRLGSQGALPVGKPMHAGEHTEAVLRDNGYSDAEIADLKTKKALD